MKLLNTAGNGLKTNAYESSNSKFENSSQLAALVGSWGKYVKLTDFYWSEKNFKV